MRAATPIILLTACLLPGCGGEADPLRGDRAELDSMATDSASVLALSERGDLMKAGQKLFRASCAECHGVTGTGLIGPNLTDDAYLNIRNPGEFFDVISYGRHAKGMPAWEDELGRAERLVLAAYAASLRGSAGGGKKAEGEELPAWETFLSE